MLQELGIRTAPVEDLELADQVACLSSEPLRKLHMNIIISKPPELFENLLFS
jgi:hypothetical protein